MSVAGQSVITHAAALSWQAGVIPEFWSIVPHAGMIYARTAAGIVWWDDGERQWRSVKKNPFDLYCMGLAAAAGSAEPIYALEGRFLFVSYDGCRTWKRRAMPFEHVPGSQTPVAADPRMPFTLYVFGQTLAATDPDWKTQHGLYWSSNAGRTWDGPLLIGPVGPPLGPVRHGLIVLAPDPAFAMSGGIFMATGHGLYQWSSMPVSGERAMPLFELPVSDKAAINAIAVGPRAKNPIAVAAHVDGDYHLKVSLDAGATWTIRDPYPHKFWIDDLLYVDDVLFAKLLHWDPAAGDKLAGAILMSRDNGATWIDITAPDLVMPLTHQMSINWPREGLAATATHLYLMSRGMGTRSIALSDLRKVVG